MQGSACILGPNTCLLSTDGKTQTSQDFTWVSHSEVEMEPTKVTYITFYNYV